MKANAILTQIIAGTSAIERAIMNAEAYPTPRNASENKELKRLIEDIHEQAEKFPSGGPGSSIRKALRQIEKILSEKNA